MLHTWWFYSNRALFIRNLDETTRTVHKENTSLAEQLSQLIKEEEALRRYNSKLNEENSLLLAESDNSQALLKEKAQDNQRKASKLQEVCKTGASACNFV